MPLKRDVKDPNSPFGGYLRNAFPSGRNRRILAQVRDLLSDRPPICGLDSDATPWIRGLIGQAVDCRIRLHFRHFRSEHLTMARQGAWAVARMEELVRLLLGSPSRLPGHTVTLLGDAPGERSDWQHLCDVETEDGDFTIWESSATKRNTGPLFSVGSVTMHALSPELAQEGLMPECILEFFELLDQTVNSVAAHCRTPSVPEERRVARFCLVLATFESIRRSNWPSLPKFLEANALGDAESLLKAVPRLWVDDVTELATSFRDRHPDWQGADAVLNPAFEGSRDVGGADGDLIADGCLWEIKTTLKSKAEGFWLFQLLGYVLLDYRNEHAIDHVGFLFPRQAASVQWNLQELVDELSGQQNASVAAMRKEVRELLRKKDGTQEATRSPWPSI